MCGSRHSSDATVTLRKHMLNFACGKFFQANLNQCSDNAATHFVQKTVPFDDKSHQWATSLDFATCQRPHGRFFGVTRIGRERLEVPLARNNGAAERIA